ncbi:MAG: trimethylamine methyltransferase family protein, partial [Pseudomonadota bacterium]
MAEGNSKRRGRKSRNRRDATPRAPFIQRRIPPLNVLSEEALCTIENNADIILRDVGMEFHDDPDILARFRAAGCDVQGARVRFEPGFCRQIICDHAPASFLQHARNADNNVLIGGEATVLCPA